MQSLTNLFNSQALGIDHSRVIKNCPLSIHDGQQLLDWYNFALSFQYISRSKEERSTCLLTSSIFANSSYFRVRLANAFWAPPTLKVHATPRMIRWHTHV